MDDSIPLGTPSPIGELSTISTQLDELAGRVTAIAEQFATTPDSQVASDLFAAERALVTAQRSLTRARSLLEP